MSDPRDIGLGWPFIPLDEDPFVGVEIAPNEIVYVVLAGTYRNLATAYEQLRQQHNRVVEAAEEQIAATNRLLSAWGLDRG